jgi:hypothetical protein
MRRLAILLGAFGLALITATGCGGTPVGDGSSGTQMNLVALPDDPAINETVTVSVSASNPEFALRSITVDFEGDGTWDEVRTFDAPSIAATFTHEYGSAGGFNVRAEVKDANGRATSRSQLLIVSASSGVPVSYRVTGTSGVTGGTCRVSGPPVTCAGCVLDIPAAGLARSLGSVPQGAPVTVTQAFLQSRLVEGTLDTRYSCAFGIDLYAGAAGSETLFAHGECTTTSVDPESLTCSITAGGDVP